MTNDPSNPEYNAKARDAIMDLCPFYDPHHKCGIVRENVFKDCLAELRERERLALASARRMDALSSAGMAKILQMEAENAEASDHVGRAEMEAAAMVSALKYIVNLSNGWNLDGSTGPGMIAGVRMSWETLARLAMDCARSAVSAEKRDAHFESQRKAAGIADEKPDGQAENDKDLARRALDSE